MSNAVFIRAEELAQELEISKAKAYKMIRQWNEELRAKGYASTPWLSIMSWIDFMFLLLSWVALF